MKTIRPDRYRSALARLDIDQRCIRIANGEVKVPATERSVLSLFPVALIPLWATGAGTIVGLWTHFCEPRRAPTYVHFYGNTAFGRREMAFEYGRSLDQALYVHLLECLTNDEGITDATRAFSEAMGLTDLEAVDEVSAESGLPEGLISLPAFRDDPPLSCFGDNTSLSAYRGDFPHTGMELSKEMLERACVFELHSGFRRMQPDYALREAASGVEQAPPWITSRDQKPIFDRLMAEADFGGAWMALNSPGWKVRDAREAALELAGAVGSEELSAVVDVWSSLPFEEGESY